MKITYCIYNFILIDEHAFTTWQPLITWKEVIHLIITLYTAESYPNDAIHAFFPSCNYRVVPKKNITFPV